MSGNTIHTFYVSSWTFNRQNRAFQNGSGQAKEYQVGHNFFEDFVNPSLFRYS